MIGKEEMTQCPACGLSRMGDGETFCGDSSILCKCQTVNVPASMLTKYLQWLEEEKAWVSPQEAKPSEENIPESCYDKYGFIDASKLREYRKQSEPPAESTEESDVEEIEEVPLIGVDDTLNGGAIATVADKVEELRVLVNRLAKEIKEIKTNFTRPSEC